MQSLEQLAVTTGITALPSIDSPQFIPQIVFDQTRGVNQPKSRFAYLFPTANSALIQIRLQAPRCRRPAGPGHRLDPAGHPHADVPLGLRRALHGDRRSRRPARSGQPDLGLDLRAAGRRRAGHGRHAADRVPPEPAAPASRWPWRSAATGITFGLLAVLGATLTMASIAVLPILIGLAVDYGIQFQARAEEAREQRDDSAAARSGEPGWQAGGMAEDPAGPISAKRAVAEAAGPGRPDDRHRGPGHGDRLPGPPALARAHGPGLRPGTGGGHRGRAGLRPERRGRGPGPGRPRARRARRFAPWGPRDRDRRAPQGARAAGAAAAGAASGGLGGRGRDARRALAAGSGRGPEPGA